jgi:hypothetical protein
VILCKLWKQIKVAIAVIDATAEFFNATKRILYVSVGYFFVTIGTVILWFLGFACVLSLNGIKASHTIIQGKEIEWRQSAQFMSGFMVIGIVWLVFFLQSKSGFVCMYGAATFYFTSNREQLGQAQICRGIWLSTFQHSGSLALGCVVHAVIPVVKWFVDLLADKTKTIKNREGNPVSCCVTCCLKNFEDLVEYLNKVAFAYVAVVGDNYCISAKNGFLVHIKHNAKYLIATSLASMFAWMGKIMVACLNCFTFWVIVKYGTANLDALSSIWGPISIIAITTLITTQLFLGLFDEATVATLHCVAIDTDLHDGKPQFGPASFHKKISKVYGQEFTSFAQFYRDKNSAKQSSMNDHELASSSKYNKDLETQS